MTQRIFVFGSNLSGIHGAGAAKHAFDKLGAEWGVGEGMTGKCYALPTKGKKIQFIPLSEVREAIDRFMLHARFSDEEYQVTQVGCGLGGFTSEQIAPFFRDAPENCFFDEAWREYLGDDANYWGTF